MTSSLSSPPIGNHAIHPDVRLNFQMMTAWIDSQAARVQQG